MNIGTNVLNEEIFQHARPLLGCWEMRHSFLLDAGGDAVVNVVERYKFTASGRGEYAYTDDSELKTESSSRFSFKVDAGRIFFKIKDSYDLENSLEFKIEDDRLVLNYGGSEEIYTRSIAEIDI